MIGNKLGRDAIFTTPTEFQQGIVTLRRCPKCGARVMTYAASGKFWCERCKWREVKSVKKWLFLGRDERHKAPHPYLFGSKEIE